MPTSRCSCSDRAASSRCCATAPSSSATGPTSCSPTSEVVARRSPSPRSRERAGAFAAVLADEYGIGQGRPGRVRQRQQPRVRARPARGGEPGRHHRRAQRLVDRAGARVRHRGHVAEGAVRRRGAARSGSRRSASQGIDMPSVTGTGVLPEVAIAEDDPFMILFTSGTTGRPKGATLTHRNLVHMGSAMAFGRTVTMLVNGQAPPPADATAAGVDLRDTVLPHLGNGAVVHDRCPLRVVAGVPAAGSLGSRSCTCGSPRSTACRRGRGCPRSSGACSSTPTSSRTTSRR